MRRALAFALCLCAQAVRADADVFTISADQWALQRSGAALLRLDPVREAVADWLGDKDARIVIQHAASDTGNLWAGELEDWLVALGVPADHIGGRASADQPDDAVVLRVEH